MFRAYWILLILFVSSFAPAQPRITIDRVGRQVLGNGIQKAPFSELFEGVVADSSMSVYVLVKSPGKSQERIFPTTIDDSRIDPAGGYRWRAVCQFGRLSGQGIGDIYEVRAAAINPSRIQRGNLLSVLNTNGIHTKAISVRRVDNR